ncbi:MAG: nickel pincer cofactor biosynthesis protein LarC [Dictyoglomaceae bacterium]|nr:nickel pincer cofactor biosynthesis protein LarC [Dictyoglomaceae bacterium]
MILYFDCFSGISGDMILGALLDLGLDSELWKKELKKIPLEGYEIKISKKNKGFLQGTDVEIISYDNKTHRHLSDLLEIIEKGDLSKKIKELSKRVFIKIAEAESKIHNEPIEKLHFHEIGAIDTIIDVVGAFIAIELLKIEEVYSSPLPLGEGFVETSHGIIPIPAPATVEILKGIPVYSTGIKGELVTPTGAGIITTLAKGFGPIPHMKIHRIGYGTGKKDFPIPNLLRVFIGDRVFEVKEDKNLVIEANIDDMNPQIYGYLMEKLFEKGALDVTLTPIFMKKGRPGILLTILLEPWKEQEITEILFKETSTIGFRKYYVDKVMMDREIKEVDTSWGKIRVKISRYGTFEKITPEYEDCKKISEKEGIPLIKVIKEVEKIIKE